MFNANKLRGVMAEKGCSAEKLAGALGINPSTLSRKMSGISEFTRSEIQIAAAFLKLSARDIQNIFFCAGTCVNARKEEVQ